VPTAAAVTFTGKRLEPAIAPKLAVEDAVAMKHGVQNLVKGTVLGIVTATGLYAAYSDIASDGTAIAKAILMYDTQVDASGLCTFSDTSAQAGNEFGAKTPTAPVYISGFFLSADLTGLDANGAADLGRFVWGDSTTGLLRVS
jgi:head decoration protein D